MKKLLIGLFTLSTLTFACPNADTHALGQLALKDKNITTTEYDKVVLHTQYVFDNALENTDNLMEAQEHTEDVVLTLTEYCNNHGLHLIIEPLVVR